MQIKIFLGWICVAFSFFEPNYFVEIKQSGTERAGVVGVCVCVCACVRVCRGGEVEGWTTLVFGF